MNPSLHNRQSTRLRGYDYSQAGLYFITVCTHNRECLFGNIVDGEMILNDAGMVANECWLQIPEHFPDAVLHEHVVMPNHVHGIIELKTDTPVGANKHSPQSNSDDNNVGAKNFSPETNKHSSPLNIDNNIGAKNFSPETNIDNNTGAKNFSPLQTNIMGNDNRANVYSPQPAITPFRSPSRTIGSIVRGYKIGVTKWFRFNTDIVTVWQRNYHDHIIRNYQSYVTISEYIINNPGKWKDDKFYEK